MLEPLIAVDWMPWEIGVWDKEVTGEGVFEWTLAEEKVLVFDNIGK